VGFGKMKLLIIVTLFITLIFCQTIKPTDTTTTSLTKTETTPITTTIDPTKTGDTTVVTSTKTETTTTIDPTKTGDTTVVTSTKTGDTTITGTPTKTSAPIDLVCGVVTFCECTGRVECGWCSAVKDNKTYAFCKELSDSNVQACSSYLGVWTTGKQEKCSVTTTPTSGKTYNVAETSGKISGTVNETTTAIMEGVVQKIVADKFGIPTTKVNVVVTVKQETDGTSFSVKVIVDSVDVPETTFKAGVESLATTVEKNMVQEGVNVDEGSVNIVNTPSDFAGKLVVSFVMAVVFMLI